MRLFLTFLIIIIIASISASPSLSTLPFAHPPENVTLVSSISPPPPKGLTAERQEEIEELILSAWEMGGQKNVYRSQGADEPNDEKIQRVMTYGEVTTLGVRQILHSMFPPSSSPVPATFVDLGSGTGKIPAQAFLENGNVVRAVGVELGEDRYKIGIRSWDQIVKVIGEEEGERKVCCWLS